MIKRPPISQNIQRQLWAESFGFCMNPECNTLLITDTASVADIAHIQEHAKGGSIEFENLILLCKNCHKIIDSSRQNDTQIENKLLQWKENRQKELREIFCKKYASFDLLKQKIVTFLQKNKNIFDLYGPQNPNASIETHNLWVQSEAEIISNNEIILTILKNNIHLIHNRYQEIINLYEQHHQDFIKTREAQTFTRQALFPTEILSIFGIENDLTHPDKNLSYLQKLLIKLDHEKRLVEFNIYPLKLLIFVNESGEEEKLLLENLPRYQQILYNEKIYYDRDKTINVRTDSIIFILNILFQHEYNWSFPAEYNFTRVLVNDSITILLVYEYEVTLHYIQTLKLEKNLIIINTHGWNDGPYSSEALQFLDELDLNIRPLNIKQFAKVCARRELKN